MKYSCSGSYLLHFTEENFTSFARRVKIRLSPCSRPATGRWRNSYKKRWQHEHNSQPVLTLVQLSRTPIVTETGTSERDGTQPCQSCCEEHNIRARIGSYKMAPMPAVPDGQTDQWQLALMSLHISY
ncbi:hypothetical protein Q7C36_008244 [Tachysurus vachellii]|uniref:Uncharacterized protein n=1 Tax=Tachysurus vachellii TaxID=175792 RepID=A0AA88NBR7_TACVA|nr:hypothetical protein Q7C36_008244 [Tachysurus vachellii]